MVRIAVLDTPATVATTAAVVVEETAGVEILTFTERLPAGTIRLAWPKARGEVVARVTGTPPEGAG